MKLNNSFNYSNPKMPNSALHISRLLKPTCVISPSLTPDWYWSYCSVWWASRPELRLRERFIIDEHLCCGGGWCRPGWLSVLQPPLRLISRVSVSQGWERFRGRERMSYLSLEASPCNCYCVLTRRHMSVFMTLVLNVHFKGLDHLEMKFLPVLFGHVTSFFCET